MKNGVMLEMVRRPFVLKDGEGKPMQEILRAGNWRQYAVYGGGKLIGLSMAQASHACRLAGDLRCRFFPCGTWEADCEPLPGEDMPPIRKEVLNAIHGTAQAEMEGVS